MESEEEYNDFFVSIDHIKHLKKKNSIPDSYYNINS